MADKFIGVAILDRSLRPQTLYLVGRKGDGTILTTDIPVYPKGSKKPSSCAWEYECHGNTLHVRPSVRIQIQHNVDLFHNDGFWIIPFEDGREKLLTEINEALIPKSGFREHAGIKIWDVVK